MGRGEGETQTSAVITRNSTRTGDVRMSVQPSPEVIAELSGRIRAVLSDRDFVTQHKLLRPEYLESDMPLAGHCYVASEALYHLVGGRDNGWKPMVIRHEGSTHWWLQGPDGQIFDLTSEQFRSPVPYEQGRGTGFLTREPSKRARVVLDALVSA
jgi:hypothetical protein